MQAFRQQQAQHQQQLVLREHRVQGDNINQDHVGNGCAMSPKNQFTQPQGIITKIQLYNAMYLYLYLTYRIFCIVQRQISPDSNQTESCASRPLQIATSMVS